MKTITKFVVAIGTGYFALANSVFAAPCGGPGLPNCDVPEPGSLPLVLLGVVAAAVAVRYFKK